MGGEYSEVLNMICLSYKMLKNSIYENNTCTWYFAKLTENAILEKVEYLVCCLNTVTTAFTLFHYYYDVQEPTWSTDYILIWSVFLHQLVDEHCGIKKSDN